MKWYEEFYVQRRDWLLSHYQFLPINAQELSLLLTVDLLKEKRVNITYDVLSQMMKMSEVEIDQMISSLSKRNLLMIHFGKKGATFDISPIFCYEEKKKTIEEENGEKDSLVIFEETFGRPLTSTELTKLSDLLQKYSREALYQALRTSDAYQKYSLAYIEAILRNDEAKR